MKCAKCGVDAPDLQRFCGGCGHRIGLKEVETPVLDRSYTPAHLARQILHSRSAIEGERKLVTVMFCDIADSTPLAARIGAERMHKVLNTFFEAALAEVHLVEGTINQFLGDGFMALFGAPLTHEDHARRAAVAALGIRNAVSSANLLQAADVTLKIRLGLNTGAVVVGRIGDNLRMDYTAIGDTTNVAARIQHLAEPGAILASDAVVRAAGDHIVWRPLGAQVLKGKVDAISIHELVSQGAHGGRGQNHPHGALIGRQPELRAIDESIAHLRTGKGGIIHIVGEAGMGKSRLLEEAVTRAGELGLSTANGSCVSFGRTLAFWPFQEAIRSAFGLEEGDEEGWSKLDTRMKRLFGDDANDLLPYIGKLLVLKLPEAVAERTRALDGLSMGNQIFRSVFLVFRRIAQDQPTVVALEDWHWADASSAALLQHLLPLVDGVPLLFVVASRPDPEGAAAGLTKALSMEDATYKSLLRLTLGPLTNSHAVELTAQLLGGGTVPPEVREALQRQSRGNPFYLGELVHALLGAKGIERDEESGEWRATDQYYSVPLPNTIEGVILARIDRLDEEVKQVVKAAAVVGRSFLYRVLEAVADSEADLDHDLAKLRQAELIDEKATTPEIEYVFKHPLIQQATYDSVLEDKRRALHKHVGISIEEIFEGRLEPFFAMLAYHYAKAQEWPKAHEYLFKAAEHADQLAADEEALALYVAVIAAAEQHSGQGLSSLQRAELENKLGHAHFRAGRHRQARVHFIAALRRVGHQPVTARWMVVGSVILGFCRQAFRHFGRLDLSAHPKTMSREDALACEILETMVWMDFFTDPVEFVHGAMVLAKISRPYPLTRAYIVGLGHVGLGFTALGMYSTADRFVSRAQAVSLATENEEMQGFVGHDKALIYHHTGQFRRAVEVAEVSAALLWKAGNIRIWAAAVGCQAMYFYSLGDSRYLERYERFSEIVKEASDGQAQGWALTWRAISEENKGQYQAALEIARKAVDHYAAIPDPRLLAHSYGLWASNLRKLGKLPEALDQSRVAISLIAKYHLTGTWCTHTLVVDAECCLAWLEAAGTMGGPEQAKARCAASKAVSAMKRQGRMVRDHGPVEAKRLAGTFDWLCGNRSRALEHWSKGLEEGRQLEALWSVARIRLERGRRTCSKIDLDASVSMFKECAAVSEILEAESLSVGLAKGLVTATG